MTDMNYEVIANIINDYNLSDKQVLQLFTNYNGLQILTDDFLNFVNNELGLDD